MLVIQGLGFDSIFAGLCNRTDAVVRGCMWKCDAWAWLSQAVSTYRGKNRELLRALLPFMSIRTSEACSSIAAVAADVAETSASETLLQWNILFDFRLEHCNSRRRRVDGCMPKLWWEL